MSGYNALWMLGIIPQSYSCFDITYGAVSSVAPNNLLASHMICDNADCDLACKINAPLEDVQNT